MQQNHRWAAARDVIMDFGIIADDVLHGEIIGKPIAPWPGSWPLIRTLKFRLSARRVAKVKYFYGVVLLPNRVVDQNRAVHQPAYVQAVANWRTDARVGAKQFQVVEERSSKSRGGIGIIFGDIADDLGQVIQRPLRVEEAVIHLGRRFRTSSAGKVRPAPASLRPSSMAASVSLSSASSSTSEKG